MRQATSPKPRLTPWPAKGCTRWAASLHRQAKPSFQSKYNQLTVCQLLQVKRSINTRKTCLTGVLMTVFQTAALTQWELPGVWHTLTHDLRPEGTWRGTLGRSPPHLEEAVEVNLPTAWWPTGRCGTESLPSQSAPTGSHYSTFQSRETRSRESDEGREKKNRQNFFGADKEISWHRSKAQVQASRSASPPPFLTNWFGRPPGAELIKRRCRPGYAVELALFEKHSMQ